MPFPFCALPPLHYESLEQTLTTCAAPHRSGNFHLQLQSHLLHGSNQCSLRSWDCCFGRRLNMEMDVVMRHISVCPYYDEYEYMYSREDWFVFGDCWELNSFVTQKTRVVEFWTSCSMMSTLMSAIALFNLVVSRSANKWSFSGITHAHGFFPRVEVRIKDVSTLQYHVSLEAEGELSRGFQHKSGHRQW